MKYSGYIPDEIVASSPDTQLAALQGRLMGDYGIPADFSEVCGALIELTRIIENMRREARGKQVPA